MSRTPITVSVPSIRAEKTRRLARWACAALLAGTLAANTVTAADRYINTYENAELHDYGTVTLQGEGHVNAGKTANVNTLTVRNDKSVGWADGGVRLGINSGSTLNVGTLNLSDGGSSSAGRRLYVFGGNGNLNIGTLNIKRKDLDALNLFSANRITVTNVNLDGGRISIANADAVFTVTGAMSNNGGTVNVDNGKFILNAGAQYIGDADSTFYVGTEENCILTVNGSFTNDGVLTNNGIVNNSGTLTNGGTFTNNGIFTNSGTFTNNGTTFTVNGTFINNGGTVNGSGTTTIAAGGKLLGNGGSFNNDINSFGTVIFNNAAVNSSANVNDGTMLVMGDSAVSGNIGITSGILGLIVNADTQGGKAMTGGITGATSDNFLVYARGGLNDTTYTLSNNFASDVSDDMLKDESFLLEYQLKKDGTKLVMTADNEDGAWLKIKGVNRSMAEAMERMADNDAVPEKMYDVAAALYGLETEKQVNDALTDLNSVTASSATTAVRAVQNALQAFGAYVAGESAQKMAIDSVLTGLSSSGDDAPRASAGGVPVECAAVVKDCERQWRGYVTAIGDFGSNNSPRDVAGSEYYGFGFLTGMERALGKDLTLGLTFSWSSHQTSLNRGLGDVKDSVFRLGAYGKWDYENFYFVTAPSAGLHLLDTRRKIRFMHQTANGERTGFDASWYNQAGIGIELPRGFLFTPSVSLGLTYFHDPDYTETGAGGANLRMDSQNHWSLLSNVGARLGRAFVISPKAVLLPEIWGGWEHEYLGVDDVRTAFAAAPDYGWKAPVVSLPDDRAVLGAGLSTLISDRYDFSLRYEARVWSTGCDHQFSLRTGMKF